MSVQMRCSLIPLTVDLSTNTDLVVFITQQILFKNLHLTNFPYIRHLNEMHNYSLNFSPYLNIDHLTHEYVDELRQNSNDYFS